MEFIFSGYAPPDFQKPSDLLTAFFTSGQAIPRPAGGLTRRKADAKQPQEVCPAVALAKADYNVMYRE